MLVILPLRQPQSLRHRLTSIKFQARMAERAKRVARLTQGPPMPRVAVPSPHGGWITVLQALPHHLNLKR